MGIDLEMDIFMECVMCGKDHSVTVDFEDFQNWENGKLAQDAFPYLDPTEREQIISGLCPSCQKKIFGC